MRLGTFIVQRRRTNTIPDNARINVNLPLKYAFTTYVCYLLHTYSLGDPDMDERLLSGVVGGVLSITAAASFPSRLAAGGGGGGGREIGWEPLAYCISNKLSFGSDVSLFSTTGVGLPGIVSSHSNDLRLLSPSSSVTFSCFGDFQPSSFGAGTDFFTDNASFT